MLAELRHCVETGDARGVEDAAHALKGSVGNFSGRAAADAAATLERMGREGALSGAGARFAELEREVERLSVADLEQALAHVDELHGILPICSYAGGYGATPTPGIRWRNT